MKFIVLFNNIKLKINYFNFDIKLFFSNLNYIPLNIINVEHFLNYYFLLNV